MEKTIIDKFNESYRNFKNSYQSYENIKIDFDNYLKIINKITNCWEQYKKLIYERELKIPGFIDLILHYKNSEIINQKIKNFLINEIKINALEKEFSEALTKFSNNSSKLFFLVEELKKQKDDVKEKMILTYEFLKNSDVLAEIENNASNQLFYPLIVDTKQINKFNDDFKATQTQLQWLLDNNIYNFYLMNKNKPFNLKFSDTFYKFHSIALKQFNKIELDFKNIWEDFSNLQSLFLCVKFLLLLFLNNFMVNIWKENSLLLKKISNEMQNQEIEYLKKMQQLWLWMSNINSQEKVTIEEFGKIIRFYQARPFNNKNLESFLINKISSEFETTKNFPNIFYNVISENIDTIIKLDNFKIYFSHWPQALINKSQLIDKGRKNFVKDFNKINSKKKEINEKLAKYAYEIMRIFNDYIQIHVDSKKSKNEITDLQQKFIQQLQENNPSLFEEFKKIIKILEHNNYNRDSFPSLEDSYINIYRNS